jgi:Cu/Ag efflux pump CusA
MAAAIIGRLVKSTLLSLVIVPVLYQLLDRARPRFDRFGDGTGRDAGSR